MASIHLVAHGQATVGDGVDQLTPLGHRQSAALGDSWEAVEWSPDRAVAGSLRRHEQTAIEVIDICGGDGHDVDARFDDRGAEESPEQFAARTWAAVESLVASAGDDSLSIAVFTSAGPIAAVTSMLLAGDHSLAGRLLPSIIDASVTTIVVERQQPVLLAFNEHAHLPRDLVTRAASV